MIMADLGFLADGGDLLLHPLAVAQHLGGLPSASARLPPVLDWMAMTMPRKLTSASGMRSASARCLVDGDAEPLALDHLEETRTDRGRDLDGDHLHGVGQRQTRLEAAHHDVDGIESLRNTSGGLR